MTQAPRPTAYLNLRPEDDYIAPGLPRDKAVTAAAVKEWRAQRDVFRPTKNDYNDPITIMLVMDALLRVNTDARFTSLQLTQILRQEYSQVLWDAYTVGRVLQNLVEASKGSGAPSDELPIASYRTAGGRTYYLAPTLRNWRWLGVARHELGKLAVEHAQRERALVKAERPSDFPWEAFSKAKWGT